MGGRWCGSLWYGWVVVVECVAALWARLVDPGLGLPHWFHSRPREQWQEGCSEVGEEYTPWDISLHIVGRTGSQGGTWQLPD